jgi:hypothetical protein
MTGTNYQKLLNVVTPELDEIYVAIRDIAIAYQVDRARGKSLENIGSMLDFPRTVGDSDTIYRERLKNLIYINTIAGTKLAIRKLLSTYLLLPLTQIIIQETNPNYLIIWLPPECEVHDKELRELVHRSVAAGIYVGFYYAVNYWDVSEWDAEGSVWC